MKKQTGKKNAFQLYPQETLNDFIKKNDQKSTCYYFIYGTGVKLLKLHGVQIH